MTDQQHIQALIQSIKEQLKHHQEYSAAKKSRKWLQQLKKQAYIQKYNDTEHLYFFRKHTPTITRIHPQNTNYPYVLSLFTNASQHVRGDTIEEVVDKAIEIIHTP